MNTSLKLTTLRGALVGLAACAATVGAFPAFAATGFGVAAPTVHVRYDDLNLQTDAGTQALYRRITKAARTVCPDPDSRELAVRIESEHCQATAIAKAVNDVNSPKLAQLYAAAHASRG